MMERIEKTNLLVRIARLYYEHDCSQQMISEKLGLSRPYVSKLINEAKKSGIVEIKIIDPNEAESQIEAELKQRFNLQKAIVIPFLEGTTGNVLDKLAAAAARFLNTIISDNDIIGVAWGATLYECSRNVVPREDIKDVTVVQLCGGISKIEKNIYASEIPKKFADAYKGTPYILPLPAIVDSVEVKSAILKDKNISSVLNIAKKSNIAIFTMGTCGYESALARAGYISQREVDELLVKGAVGDICCRIINAEGEICDDALNQRTIGIELNELKEKEYRIGVAIGNSKVRCMYGALRGGYPNVIMTDEATARELLKLCESEE